MNTDEAMINPDSIRRAAALIGGYIRKTPVMVIDGRDLDLDYAHNVCDHLLDLWGDDFKFYTIIEEEPFEI